MKRLLLTLSLTLLLVSAGFSQSQFLSVTGDFQTEAGFAENWKPYLGPELTDGDGDGVYEATFNISTAGDYNWKITPEDAWSGSKFPGSNQPLSTASDNESVTFYVNFGANLITNEGDEVVIHTAADQIAAGTFQSEIGSPSDWNTDGLTAQSIMVDDGTGGDDIAGDLVWTFESVIPAGTYDWKPALNESWTFLGGASNRTFGSDGITPIKFTYDLVTGTIDETGDDESPNALSAYQSYNDEWVVIEFQDPVEKTSAETVGNYGIDNGIIVYSATRYEDDQKYVALNVSTLTPGTAYTVTINNIQSRDSGLVMTAPDTVEFTGKTPVTFSFDNNLDEHPMDWMIVKGSWDGWTYQAPLADDGSGNDIFPRLPGTQPSDDVTTGDNIWTGTVLIEPGDYSTDGYAYSGGNIDPGDTFEWKYLFAENFGRASTDGAMIVGSTPLTRDNEDMVDNWTNLYPNIQVTFTVDISGAALPTDPDWVSIQGSDTPLDWTPGSNKMTDNGGGTYSITVNFGYGAFSPVEYKYTYYLLGEEWESYPNTIHNRLISLWPQDFSVSDELNVWAAHLNNEPVAPPPVTSVTAPWQMYE